MRFSAKNYLGVLAVVIMSMPVWAGNDTARKVSTGLEISRATMVGNTELKPGSYKIEATESANQFTVLRAGKVVATVPCHWITLPSKATSSIVSTDGGRVDEIEFQGSDQAIKVGQS
jgi:hypothetical protein